VRRLEEPELMEGGIGREEEGRRLVEGTDGREVGRSVVKTSMCKQLSREMEYEKKLFRRAEQERVGSNAGVHAREGLLALWLS
jgi:hypothetical protein